MAKYALVCLFVCLFKSNDTVYYIDFTLDSCQIVTMTYIDRCQVLVKYQVELEFCFLNNICISYFV
jgi:hypothetical protein